MDQIRFDFLNTQAITTRNQQAAPADGVDAFAQILDQQLAKAKDAAVQQQQSQDSPRTTDDWRRPGDATAEKPDTARAKVSGRRRDDKTAVATNTATATKPKTAQKPATASTKAGEAKTSDTTKPGQACDDAKSDDGDDKKDIAVTAQSSGDSTTTAPKTTAENQPGTHADSSSQQQQDQSEDGQAATPQPDTHAPSDADLAALMIPLPVQTISTPAGAKTTLLVGGGASTPALQAALLAAASLNAEALNLTGGTNAQAQTATPGLKFGAILPGPTPAQTKAGTDAAATDLPGGDTADAAADSPDPSDAVSAFQASPKPQANASASTASTRSRATATASSPVANAYAGQSGATTTPSIDPRAVQPWATSNIVASAAEDTLTAPVVAGDTEPSSWSQYLDAGVGTGSAGISARTAAFLAQLKQNVQAPPPHEQVAIQIQKAMQNGSTRLTVNLEPAELGRVEVKLDMDKDKNVTATIVVDRPATLDLLQRDAKQLERALQDAGLQTNDGSLSFSLRNSAGQGGGQGGNGQAGAGTGGQNAGAQPQEAANQPARTDVIATADGYVDLET